MISVRGATTVHINEKEAILQATEEMLKEILISNNIAAEDIISVLFSATKDLNKVYPAVAARKLGITEAALMCFDELFVEGSLEKSIRVMVNAESGLKQSEVNHVYLKNAVNLRPDLVGKNPKKFAVAIDGPSGAGKSTVAKKCADSLGFYYVDTGAMYRAFAYYCVENGIDTGNANEVNKHIENINVTISFADGIQRVFLNGEDVSEKIRTQIVAENTSKVSAIKEVRRKLVESQREFAKGNNVIMDGRDIGTVVLPEAILKIYLDADVEIRAKRRYKELIASGEKADLDTITQEVKARDFRDMNRDTDPLKKASDAMVINSSQLTLNDVCEIITGLIKGRISQPKER